MARCVFRSVAPVIANNVLALRIDVIDSGLELYHAS
jgi:hypothetical protein